MDPGDSHDGMSRAADGQREQVLARETFEQEATGDLEGPPPTADVPAGLSAKRRDYFLFAAWLKSEESKLGELERKRAELEASIAAPAEYESTVRALLRRTADALLRGLPADASDAAKRQELEAKHAQQRLQAVAAGLALPEIEKQIEVATLRVGRLRQRESEFLAPVLFELAEGTERLLARKKAEVEALERLLKPLYAHYWQYGMQRFEPEQPRVECKWKGDWHSVAEALAADPAVDVRKILPKIKF
jgi:hypothetical protein